MREAIYYNMAIAIVMAAILRGKMYYVYGHLHLKMGAVTVEIYYNMAIAIVMAAILRGKMYHVYGHLHLKMGAVTVEKVTWLKCRVATNIHNLQQ